MTTFDRELVVFVPAVGGDHSFWRPQVEALSDRYDTLAVDLVRPAEEVSMAGFADDVAAAIAGAGYAQAHVVGLSMGGVVALELFRRHPDRVRSLVLASSWAYQPDGPDRFRWVSGELATKSVAEFSQMSLPGLFAPTTDRAVVEHGIAVESAKDKAMYLACWKDMLHADLRPLLPLIDVPMLLIGGALDPVTPPHPLLTMIRDAVPTARLVDLPRASHFSNLDCPDEFTGLLRTFLRSARGKGGDRLTPPPLEDVTLAAGPVAEQLLRMLSLRRVELFVSNSGTDFTPLIDALAHLADDPSFALRVVPAPHENTAIAIAHGYALLSKRPAAVMGHVGVGTANMGLGIINARRAHVPMLVLAGRSPWYEQDKAGVRTNFVQWGQDTFDQGAYFREFTKWDYELKGPHALETVVDRAVSLACADPPGPVYLTLPKEPLCEQAPARRVARGSRLTPSRAGIADPVLIDKACHWIRSARAPLIVTADVGRQAGGAEALVQFAVAAGGGVVEHGKRNFFNFPTHHPHHWGFEPMPHLSAADLVLAVQCPVPWIPALAKLDRVPPVIQIALDPLFSDIPMRGFPSDLSLGGDPVATLRLLAARLRGKQAPAERADIAEVHRKLFSQAMDEAQAHGKKERITKTYLSHVIGQVIDDDCIVFNEYNLDPMLVPRRHPDSWFENSVASGLGWSLGAALGAKIAAPEKTMVVTLGDGAYLFNTPLSAHGVAAAEGLPILIIIFNDSAWSTIKKSTRGSHPDGWAVRTGRFPLCDFTTSIDYARVAEACGGGGITVERPADLSGRLREALSLVRSGSRHVLVNVLCERDG